MAILEAFDGCVRIPCSPPLLVPRVILFGITDLGQIIKHFLDTFCVHPVKFKGVWCVPDRCRNQRASECPQTIPPNLPEWPYFQDSIDLFSPKFCQLRPCSDALNTPLDVFQPERRERCVYTLCPATIPGSSPGSKEWFQAELH